jgi:hypothetical protein
VSALSFVVLSAFSFYKRLYFLSAVAGFVFVTSIVYWSNPEINCLARKIDIFASILLLITGSVVSFQLNQGAVFVWFTCLFIQLTLYSWNHHVYKRIVTIPDIQVCEMLEKKQKDYEANQTFFCKKSEYLKLLDDNEIVKNCNKSTLHLSEYLFDTTVISWPNTEVRELALYNGMIAHMIFNHLLPNLVAIFCLIYFC